ncbi:hypothetical protein OIU74_020685 [Salix koriyanagi]|uniref:Uncharacterized protein n=1 Tax=Salix koriyanagi TaxID=2511006 RepID=A0A9Q0P6Q0_9ROSI|nr:hypothetical protein OIU74_020685 [Salix koriyanagi]
MAQLEVEFLHECFGTNFSGCVSPIMKLLVRIYDHFNPSIFRRELQSPSFTFQSMLLFFGSRNCIRMKRNSAHRPGQDFAGPSKIYLLARKLERQSHLEPHFEAPGFCVVLPDNKEAAELFNSIIDENLSCVLRVTNTLAARMPCQTKPMLASGNEICDLGERSSTSRGKTMMVEDVHLLKRFWRN